MIYPDCSNEEDMQLLFLLQPGGLVQHSTVPGCAVFAMKVVEGEPRITFARLSDSVPAGLGWARLGWLGWAGLGLAGLGHTI